MTVKQAPVVVTSKSADPAIAAAIQDINRAIAQLVSMINALDARITKLGG